MKISVSLAQSGGLEQDYASAWEEWEASGEADAWDSTRADGLGDASR